MKEQIAKLREEAFNKDLGVAVAAMDQLIEMAVLAGDALVDALGAAENKEIVADRINMAFWKHLVRLRSHLTPNGTEMAFYCATLLVHYGVKDADAENILLYAVKAGPMERAWLAATILVRTNHKEVGEAIGERFQIRLMDEKEERFFREKLAYLNR